MARTAAELASAGVSSVLAIARDPGSVLGDISSDPPDGQYRQWRQ